MRTIRILASVGVIMASLSPAFAGSPNNPGGLGDVVTFSKGFWQDAAGNSNGWGQAIKANNEAGGNPLGQYLQGPPYYVKDTVGASPNPANDNGGGND